ncbi:MAG: hypothetical protein QXR60_02410 [Candidatus Nanoarchaeia archaeon]
MEEEKNRGKSTVVLLHIFIFLMLVGLANAQNSFTFNVSATVSSLETPAQPSGGGGGGVTPPTADFTTDIKIISIEIEEGGEEEKTISITNTGTKNIVVKINHNLPGYIQIKETSFSLPIGQTKEIKFNIIAKEPAIKSGIIKIEAEDVTKTIPVIIQISSSKALFDIKLEMLREGTRITEGQDLNAVITIINMLPGKEDVTLEYTITDFYGNELYKETETMAVEGQKSFTKTFKTNQLKPGQYVAGVILKHEKTFSTSATDFEIETKEIKIEKPTPITIKYLENYQYLAAALIATLAVTLLIKLLIKMRYKKYAKKKNKP